MTKLTDTQLVVLSAAAARDDRSVLPLPKSLKGGAVTKVLNALITRGLIEQVEDPRYAVEDGFRITRAGLRAINADDDSSGEEWRPQRGVHDRGKNESTQGGDVAVEPDSGATAPTKRKHADTRPDSGGQGQDAGRAGVKPRSGTKQAIMIDLLSRAQGATIAQLRQATGWQSHTCRGAMSGVIKKKLGLAITSAKDSSGNRIYKIAS